VIQGSHVDDAAEKAELEFGEDLRTAMEWLLRYCRAKSLTEELAMMTLMPEAAISLIICE
jgi:hypothetical protein